MRTHLIISDQHASPEGDMRVADLVGKLIADLRPEVVVNIGDAADLESLNSFDVGKKQFSGKNYQCDLDAHLEFQDRLFNEMKKRKKKQPYRVVHEGNHENRIKKAINLQPHLEGDKYGISFKDLQFKENYHDVIEYNGTTPGVNTIDGVTYAHFMVSGVLGRAIGGEHHAASLIQKHYSSCTVGHSHLAGFAHRSNVNGEKILGAVVGTLQYPTPQWAGEASKLWWHGLMIAHNVENGCYDPEFVSLKRLRSIYNV